MAKKKTKAPVEEPESTTQEDLMGLGLSGKSMEEVIKEAEITNAPSHETEADEAKEIPKAEEKSEPAKAEAAVESDKQNAEEKVADVSQTADKQTEEGIADVPKEDMQELTEEQKEWKLAYDNKESWENALKKKSMVFSLWEKLTDEQRANIEPYLLNLAYGKEKIPETPQDLVKETVEKTVTALPDKITYTDEDGYENIIPRTQLMPYIEKVVSEAIKTVAPDSATVRKELQEKVETLKDFETKNATLQVELGLMRLQNLITKHPELDITPVNETEELYEKINRVTEAGDAHPEYEKIVRIETVANMAQKHNVSLEKAWDILYGNIALKEKRQKEAEESIKEKQQKIQPEKPGQTVQPSEKERILKEMGMQDSPAQKVAEIFGS